MINTIADIQNLVRYGFSDWKQAGNVSVSQDGDLLLFNYTPLAQYEATWNFFERVSRGLIIHSKTGEIVARPFDKFFNWLEGGRRSDAAIASITEKMDGSLGILYRTDGDYRIATRGAFHSPQAEWATEYLNEHRNLSKINDEWTLLFEIIYPENRIVVNYGNRESLVLLAIRNRFTGTYLSRLQVTFVATLYGFSLPSIYSFNTVDDIINKLPGLKASEEGYVVEFADGQRFKFKGEEYLRLHKLISNISFKNTLEAVRSGTVDYIRSQIPDEFLREFNEWVKQIEITVSLAKTIVYNAYEEAPKSSRKEFALWAQENHKNLCPYLFAVLDNRDITPLIYNIEFKDKSDE